jgi:hypothetical protein
MPGPTDSTRYRQTNQEIHCFSEMNSCSASQFVINVFQSEFGEQGGKVGITINTNWGEPVEANNPEHQQASDRYLSFQFYKGCGVAKRVRRSSAGCGVGQLVLRRLAVRQARVRFSVRHHREGFPTELTSDEEMERNLGEWRRMNVLYECDGWNVCTIKI